MRNTSIVKFELRRMLRDTKALLCLVVVFGVPFLANVAGGSVVKVQMLLALFLPVVIGWSWGSDVASGRLVQLAASHYSSGRLLAARAVVLGAIFTLGVFLVTLGSGASLEEAATAVLFTLHMTLFGFCLATGFRSADVGWLPIFSAFAGVWLPMLLVMKRTGGATPQLWLHWLTAMFLPQFALGLTFYSPRQLMIAYGCLAVAWVVLAGLAIQRPGALDRRGND